MNQANRAEKRDGKTRSPISVDGRRYVCHLIDGVADTISLARLPVSIKVLLENVLRHAETIEDFDRVLDNFRHWPNADEDAVELPFRPVRVVMPDSSGIPVMADLTAMRNAVARFGGEPDLINPVVPVDLVVDHSVQVEASGHRDAFAINLKREYEANEERYSFLKWASRAYRNFKVMPPGAGIVHQVNMEYLAHPVWTEADGEDTLCFPDTLLGLDSHTPMVNALGVLGWGVGGIEAASVMLGESISLNLPSVVGCRLTGDIAAGVTATDVVLTVTECLRKHNVVGAIVEFCGPGVHALSLPDRATISNMAPEYGANMGFFPIDSNTIAYLAGIGRPEHELKLTEAYARKQGMWGDDHRRVYSSALEIDLSAIEPSMAGPKRPQERRRLSDVPRSFLEATPRAGAVGAIDVRDPARPMQDGDIVIAAITSCTNTSNPRLLVAAGLLARNARARGLSTKPWVKTSFSPGSQIVSDYMASSGLQEAMDALRFQIVGYGCMTCAGGSGPLLPDATAAVEERQVAAVAVLSGNRNFEGRIHPLVQAGYLGAPALVVAYALAGSILVDLVNEPLGYDSESRPVRLADIMPSDEEVGAVVEKALRPDMYARRYADVWDGDEHWSGLSVQDGRTYEWDPASTYLCEPPFFEGMPRVAPAPSAIKGARALLVVGDGITTDHISPVSPITAKSDAGEYLAACGVGPGDFHTFLARRVNHEVMIRGTYGNPRLRNEMTGETGSLTVHKPSNHVMSVFRAAEAYRAENVPLVVVAGTDYGAGSSRDWAAKGTRLLGIRAILAESFERIHRSNLVGMGVLPMQFMPGSSRKSLGLVGDEEYDLVSDFDALKPRGVAEWRVTRIGGESFVLPMRVRIDTKRELEWYRNGGVLPLLIRKLAL